MADTPNASTDDQIPAGAASGAEAQVFDDIVRRMGPLPAGVRRVQFRFGEDSEGAPAVWITFIAGDDLKPSKEKIADLQRVASKVRAEILRSESERWPYVEIVTE
jgi:hypothetical protein